MAHPLASMIRLLAAPKITVISSGLMHIDLPFLKLIGSRAGSIDFQTADEQTGPAGWIAVVQHLLPSATSLSYDTAGASVELRYVLSKSSPNHPADDEQMSMCVDKLMIVATESAARFMVMSRDRRERAKVELVRSLEDSPVDLRDDDAVALLTAMMDLL